MQDGQKVISERHRHRHEFNNDYRAALEEAGLKAAGQSRDGLWEVRNRPSFFCLPVSSGIYINTA